MFDLPSEQPDGRDRLDRSGDSAGGGKGAADREQLAHDLNNHGVWLLTTGKLQMAAKCFRRACAVLPNLATAWINLASTLVSMGKPEEAIVVIRQAAKTGAISRTVASRYRSTIRQQIDKRFMLTRKHNLQEQRRQVGDASEQILVPPQTPQVAQPAGLLDTAGFGVFSGYTGLLGA